MAVTRCGGGERTLLQAAAVPAAISLRCAGLVALEILPLPLIHDEPLFRSLLTTKFSAHSSRFRITVSMADVR